MIKVKTVVNLLLIAVGAILFSMSGMLAYMTFINKLYLVSVLLIYVSHISIAYTVTFC